MAGIDCYSCSFSYSLCPHTKGEFFNRGITPNKRTCPYVEISKLKKKIQKLKKEIKK